MSSEHEIHKIYMFITFVAGVILTGISATAFDHMTEKCTSKMIRRGMTTIMALGATLMTVAFAFWYCNRDEDIACNTDIGVPKLVFFYQVFATVLSGFILFLAISMWMEHEKSEYKKTCGKHLNAYLIPVIIICGLVVGSSGYFLYRRIWGNHGKQ